MSQLTTHQLHSIEDKIQEGYNNSQIASFIKKDRSTVVRLFRKYPRNTFHAETVIQERFKTKSITTQSHIRIEP